MLISHCSDQHSKLVTLPESDIIISTGDLLPDERWRTNDFHALALSQAKWTKKHLKNFKEWIGDKPFFSLDGNHHFLHSALFTSILQSAEIKAYDITDKLVEYNGIKIYGFSPIPFINGAWNHEFQMPEMAIKINELKDVLINNKIDILATHAPPAMIIDQEDGSPHYGNSYLTNLLFYNEEINLPKCVLFGHIHTPNSPRIQTLTIQNKDILFSNAATVVNLLNVEF